MAAPSDPRTVGRYDEEHLRRFLTARARDDEAGMRRWWGELVIDFFDRMDGLVYAAHRGRLDDEEHEIAVQQAMIRFSQNLITTFEGVSMGELVNATRTLARGICMDVQAASMRRREHEAASLEEGWDRDAEDAASGSAWEAGEAWRRMEAEERGRDAAGFLVWALPQVGENRRRVLERTFEGAELEEICAELGIERDNAYARRSRGMKDLIELKEQWDT